MEKQVSLQKNECVEAPVTKRKANFELLRLIAMLMVVALHYLGKGLLLPEFSDGFPTGNQCLAYLIESFSIVSVDAFVLLSGYFLVKAEFKCERVLQLVAQVLFYSLLVPTVLLAAGVLKLDNLNFYDLINNVFPVQTEHYWFATHYIFLYLFTPILNRAIRAMNQKQLRIAVLILIMTFSVPKSILPVVLPFDKSGYDVIWFICVYMLAAYIRLYGISFYKNKKVSIFMYVICAVGVFLWNMVIGIFYLYTGKFVDQIGEVLQYNHILNLLAAVSFFYIFIHSEIRNHKWSRLICSLSPYAFGVYLLHEQLQIRYLWPTWLQVHETGKTIWFLPHFLLTIIGIFVLGLAIDCIRAKIFAGIGAYFKDTRIEKLFQSIDNQLRIGENQEQENQEQEKQE